MSTLADADPEDKAELYRELRVNLTYSPNGRVNVQVLPRGVNVRVGGANTPTPTPVLYDGLLDLAKPA